MEMIFLTGDNVFTESKKLLSKVNFDLDLKQNNPLIHKDDNAQPHTLEYKTNANFDKTYQELLMNGKLGSIVDEKTNKICSGFRGIAVLRDGHICAILDEEVHFLHPLYYNHNTGCVHLHRMIVASEVPFENNGIPAEDYNDRARKLLNATEQASKQIIAIIVK